MQQTFKTMIALGVMAASLNVNADSSSYFNSGIFGQVVHQGVTLTVAESGYSDNSANIGQPAADFVMADGCLFAEGHATTPIQFDAAAAQLKNVRASGEIVGYGYDYCHHNRPFVLRISFALDLAPLRPDGKAITSTLKQLNQDNATAISQSKDADEIVASAKASITSSLTFMEGNYTFIQTVSPTEGTVGYLRERSVTVKN